MLLVVGIILIEDKFIMAVSEVFNILNILVDGITVCDSILCRVSIDCFQIFPCFLCDIWKE